VAWVIRHIESGIEILTRTHDELLRESQIARKKWGPDARLLVRLLLNGVPANTKRCAPQPETRDLSDNQHSQEVEP
jgi:hypothetical protein